MKRILKNKNQVWFQHHLKIENLDTKTLFPDEQITKKQNKALNVIIANCLSAPNKKIHIIFSGRAFQKGSPAALSGYGLTPFKRTRELLEKTGYIETFSEIYIHNDSNHPLSWIKGLPKLYSNIPKSNNPLFMKNKN